MGSYYYAFQDAMAARDSAVLTLTMIGVSLGLAWALMDSRFIGLKVLPLARAALGITTLGIYLGTVYICLAGG